VETTDASGGCVRVASEDMTAMPADWQSQTSANGQIGFVPHAGVKGGALRAELTQDPAASPGADLSKSFPLGPSVTSVRLSFAVKVVALDPVGNYAEIGCVLQLGQDAAARGRIKVVLTQETMRLDEIATSTGGSAFAGPVFGQWYAVTMAMENITSSSATAVASVDGVARLSKPIDYLTSPNNVRVECGIDYANQSTSLVVLVDDVTLDFCD
jgi:hypothetical protein